MWDKLAECTASTIDQFFTWKQTFFGPIPTFPPPPCNVVRKERLADESSNIASGGKGGASKYCSKDVTFVLLHRPRRNLEESARYGVSGLP